MEMEERSALTAGGGALLDAPAGVAACWADGCGGGFGIGADMAERQRRAAVLSQAITSSVVDLQITPSRDLPNELPDLLVLVVFFVEYWFWLLIISHTLIVLIINFCPVSMQQEITFVNYCVQEHNDPSILNRHWNSRRTPLSSMAQLLQYRCTMDAARLQNRRKHIIKLNVMLQMRRATRIEERKKV